MELMWAKVKSLLPSAKARSQQELPDAIADALGKIRPSDTSGVFSCHCCVGIIYQYALNGPGRYGNGRDCQPQWLTVDDQ